MNKIKTSEKFKCYKPVMNQWSAISVKPCKNYCGWGACTDLKQQDR